MEASSASRVSSNVEDLDSVQCPSGLGSIFLSFSGLLEHHKNSGTVFNAIPGLATPFPCEVGRPIFSGMLALY